MKSSGNNFISSLNFSWQGIFLYSITNFIAVFSAFPGQKIDVWVLLLLSAFIAVSVALGIFLLWSITKRIASKHFRYSIGIFSLIAMAFGIGRGFLFFFLVENLGIEQPTPLPIRILTSTITTAIWLTFSCALIEATSNYSRRFSKLFNDAALAWALENKNKTIPISSIDALDDLVALKENLARIRNEASLQGVSAEALTNAGIAVRQQIELLLKPLSRRLWFNSKSNRTEIRLLGLLQDSYREFSFATPRVLAIWSCLAFASIVNAYSLNRVIFGVALSVVLIWITMASARALIGDQESKHSRLRTAIYIFLVAVIPVSLADFLMPVFGYERMLFPISAATLVSPIAIAVLLIADSALNLVEQDRRFVSKLFEDEIVGNFSGNQKSLASYLHNSLQSELTGIAYRLEASAANPESLESRETLEKLGALINRSIGEDFASFDETPMLRLDRMIQAWDGIASVHVEIDNVLKEDSRRLNKIVQIIEEVTTNSARYGRAKNIWFRVVKSAQSVKIEIRNDSPELPKVRSGIGSHWIQENSLKVSQFSLDGSFVSFSIEL